MPEDNPETGVKVASEESPSPETHVEAVEPPAESTPVQPKPEKEQYVPYARFHDVNAKMRSLEAELAKRDAEKLAPQKVEVPGLDDLLGEIDMSKYSETLAANGLDPKASTVLAAIMKDIAKEEAKSRYQKESAKAEERRAASETENRSRLEKAAKDISDWQEEFRKTHKDYAKYEPAMQKQWEALDPEAKKAFVTSPKSYELLYKVAKADDVEKARAEGEEAGRKDAYETKSLKTALTSAPGATANPKKKFTAEDVPSMSAEFYKANKDQILSDLGIKK